MSLNICSQSKLNIRFRNKNSLNSPISQSFANLVKYHLGTVALGSLLIAIVQIVRAILKLVEVSQLNLSM